MEQRFNKQRGRAATIRAFATRQNQMPPQRNTTYTIDSPPMRPVHVS